MDIAELWDTASGWIAGVALIATGASAIASLVKHKRGFSSWRENKRERKRALNHLIETAGRLEDACKLPEQMEKLSKNVTSTTIAVDRLADTVQRHEDYIIDSLEERRHLTAGMLAVLDWTIKNGANGEAHEARDAMRAYLNDKSHK